MLNNRILSIFCFSWVACFFFLGLGCRPGIKQDPFYPVYKQNCVACHGDEFQGTPQGPSLVTGELKHGLSTPELIASIANGYPEKGMPGFGNTLSETEIKRIAIMIAELRQSYDMNDYKFSAPIEIPTEVVQTEVHNFRIEVVAEGLDPWPYSIAPLPEGRILLVEKTKGLSIISPDGSQSDLIRNTPKVYDDVTFSGSLLGAGWMLEVALHPNYEENGWIYLSYSDRCSDCNEQSRELDMDVSMCALIRGRIKEGGWVDQETIWKADIESYVATLSPAIGGRIAFDHHGHVFLSVGGIVWSPHPPGNIEAYVDIQNLSLPYGKIFRFTEDGQIPADNPFVDSVDVLPGIWSYGHRSPQGLVFDTVSEQLWETEMGPRGGDEVNVLKPGRNYGWPLTSKGVNYDGSEVNFGEILGIEFDLADLEQPIVDLTPSPAVSSCTIYEGEAFHSWKGDLIVGSLKATELFRMVRNGDEVIQVETLLNNFARIRDVEMGPEGFIYLLLEHQAGSQIVRLIPTD